MIPRLHIPQTIANFASVIDIIPHIQYLVCHHDCVVIPGWGALVADGVEPRTEGCLLLPPGRTLTFNPEIDHNDGLLASSVARREGISYDTAMLAVNAAVEDMARVFSSTGRLEMERVGTFERAGHSKIRFTAEQLGGNIANAEYAGLPAVALAEASTESTALAAGTHIAALAGLRRFGRAAVAAVAVIALAITLSTPVSVDRSGITYASLGTPKVTAAKPVAIPLPAPEDATLHIPAPPAGAVETVAEPRTDGSREAAARESVVTAGPFYLVVSSHSTLGEARRYIASRPREELGVVAGSGRFRVYAANGASAEAVRAIAAANPAIMQQHPDAWVCHNR